MASWPTVDELGVHLDFVDPEQVTEQRAQLSGVLEAATEQVELYTTRDRRAVSDVPSSLHLAILIMAAHLWEAQRGNAAQSFVEGGGVPRGFAMPNRAWELMRPYMVVGVV